MISPIFRFPQKTDKMESQMQKIRRYGKAPFAVAVIHGGPGAPGEMAPVASVISSSAGVLEPLQSADTIEGQIEELESAAFEHGHPPLTLVGWSWGAWLGFLFASSHPTLVRKLVLIASGPFEEKDAQTIMKTRLNRLSAKDRVLALFLIDALEDPSMEDKDAHLMRLGELMSRADSFDPMPFERHTLGCRYDIYRKVWEQASELRRSGALVESGKKIRCPVVAIHGDFDPHPAEGVRRPLSRILKDFRFVSMEKCGHTPWIERQSKDRFYEVLIQELGSPVR
jgi:pimeloyl-ACP methyl ester carboxylesterase